MALTQRCSAMVFLALQLALLAYVNVAIEQCDSEPVQSGAAPTNECTNCIAQGSYNAGDMPGGRRPFHIRSSSAVPLCRSSRL